MRGEASSERTGLWFAELEVMKDKRWRHRTRTTRYHVTPTDRPLRRYKINFARKFRNSTRRHVDLAKLQTSLDSGVLEML